MEDVEILALIILFAIVAIFLVHFMRRGRERFVSERAQKIHDAVKQTMDDSDKPTDVKFSNVRRRMHDIDAVEFTDARNLWIAGGLSPVNIQSTL